MGRLLGRAVIFIINNNGHLKNISLTWTPAIRRSAMGAVVPMTRRVGSDAVTMRGGSALEQRDDLLVGAVIS